VNRVYKPKSGALIPSLPVNNAAAAGANSIKQQNQHPIAQPAPPPVAPVILPTPPIVKPITEPTPPPIKPVVQPAPPASPIVQPTIVFPVPSLASVGMQTTNNVVQSSPSQRPSHTGSTSQSINKPKVEHVEESEKFKLILNKLVTNADGKTSAEIDIATLSDFIKINIIPLHMQFLIDKQTDHENAILEEVRQIYCKISKIKKDQLVLTAQLSPILAARSINMQPCERISGRGESLLLQECKPITKEIGAFQSICNFQPYFTHNGLNWSLAADGWTPIRITGDQNNFCFWREGHYVNINGNSYYWKHDVNNVDRGFWQLQQANIHQSHLSLIKRFEILPVNDYDYRLLGHNFHGQSEVEHLSILMELAGRAQQYGSNSLEGITTIDKREAVTKDMFGWLKALRIIVFGIIGFIIFAMCLKVFLIFNPIPVIDKILEETSNKMKETRMERKSKKKEKKEKGGSIEVEPPYNESVSTSAPPVYLIDCGCRVGAE